MIKMDELREFRPQIRYQNGEGISLSSVQDAINDCAMKMGIPVAFRGDQVKSGGMLKATVEDCLVMYHPEHENDYFKFCIRVKHQGVYAFVSINDFGRSKQMNKAGYAENYKADRRGQPLSYQVFSMIGEGIMTFGKNKAKFEEENMYYQCVFDIFDEIVS